MKYIQDYKHPFDAIKEFEKEVALFTGAPFCVTTDCCTHAIEIAFLLQPEISDVRIPYSTYLSVPMTLHKLGIIYTIHDNNWKGEYNFQNSNIWDSARKFEKNMYRSGNIQCISFGRTKPLEIGLGGCLLTDDKAVYEKASRMRYDGRDIFKYDYWPEQIEFSLGFHYYMRPEECIIGLNKLHNKEFVPQIDKLYNYPDIRKIVFK